MDDEEPAWDPLKFILENKNENVSCYKYMYEMLKREILILINEKVCVCVLYEIM